MDTTIHTSAWSAIEASGRYKVIVEAGRSFGGVVFKARDVEDDSVVAVKLFADWLQKRPAFRADLKLVVPRLAGVFHPNMVEVFRLWENGEVYMSMDFVEGESLARILDREGRVPPERALEIAASIARVLDFARRNNMIHGSVKPSSVLIDTSGTVRLEGIGLPVAPCPTDVMTIEAGDSSRGRTTPLSEGEAAYFAGYDRILECRPGEPQMDFYGIGMILYHMLTGAPPVVGKNLPDVLFKLRRLGWPSLSKAAPALPADLLRIVERLSGRGYSSCDKLIADLSSVRGVMSQAAGVPHGGVSPPVSEPAHQVSAIDRFCEQEARDAVPSHKTGRIRQVIVRVTEQMRRPIVRLPLFIACGLGCALLAALLVFRPIYLSTLAPPLPHDAVENLSPIPTVPLLGTAAAQGAGTADRGTQSVDGADKAFSEASRFFNSFPDQYDLAIEKFNAIAAAQPGTKWETDAQSRICEIVAAREELMAHTYESLTRDANTLVEWEDYAAALALYESFLSTFPQTKFKDVISAEMRRIRKNAATKVAVLTERADSYIEKCLPELAKVELERIIELAVDKETIDRAVARLAEARTIADLIAKEREAASRTLAEELRFRVFVEDEIPPVLQKAAAFDYDEARALLAWMVKRLPEPRSEKVVAVVEALTVSVSEDEKFVQSVFKQVNERARTVRLNEFYSRPLKGTVTKVDKTRVTFKLEDAVVTAATRWTDLGSEEILRFFSLFRGLSIEHALPFGCFCFHRGYKEEAVKFLRMAQGVSDKSRSRIAGRLLELCEP
jgi:serine/threonine-protein kinase